MTAQVIWTEVKLLAREPLTLLVSLLFPVVLLVLLVGSFGNDPDPDFGGVGGTDFYVPVAGLAAGTLGFAALGLLLGSLAPTARAAQGLGLLLFFGLFFIAGGGPPPALLPDTINRFVELTPMGSLVSAVSDPRHGHGIDSAALLTLSALAAVAGLLAQRPDYVPGYRSPTPPPTSSGDHPAARPGHRPCRFADHHEGHQGPAVTAAQDRSARRRRRHRRRARRDAG